MHPGMVKHLKKFKNKFVKHYRKSLPTGIGHSKNTTTNQLKKLNDFNQNAGLPEKSEDGDWHD